MLTRHRADFLSLTFGLLFAAIGLVLLTGNGGLSLTWVGPLVAVALGVLLLVAARTSRDTPGDPPPD